MLGSALELVLTLVLSVLSQRRGWDLDAVATPVITAVGDMVTIPSLFLATFLTRVAWLNGAVAAMCGLGSLFVTWRGIRTDLPLVGRVQLEMAPVILLTPLMDIAAGTLVEARLERFVAFPALLILIPTLVSNAGALGGILTSRLASKLHIGVIEPRFRPDGPALLEAGLVAGMGSVVFVGIALAGIALSAGFDRASPGDGVLFISTLGAGLLAMPVALTFAYGLAIVTRRFGLDPDNHGVPIITSVMDLAGVSAFLVVLALLGVQAP